MAVVHRQYRNLHNQAITAVICTRCNEVLNFGKKVVLEWYDVINLFKITGDSVLFDYNRYNLKWRLFNNGLRTNSS